MVLVVKNLSARAGNARDAGLIPESGRSPGEGNGNSFQYSCLENPMDRGAWRATVHGVAKSRAQLSTHIHAHVFLKVGNCWVKQQKVYVSLYKKRPGFLSPVVENPLAMLGTWVRSLVWEPRSHVPRSN